MSIKEIVIKITDSNNKALILLEQLTEKISNIFNINKNKYLANIKNNISRLKTLNNELINEKSMDENTINVYFKIISNIEECSILFKKIHQELDNILSKSKNIETYLSQTFIDETIEFHKKISKIYLQINKEEINGQVINIILEKETKVIAYMTEEKLLNYIKDIQQMYYKYPIAQELYTSIIKNILQNVKSWIPESGQILYNIKNIIENDKTYILNQINILHKKKSPKQSSLLDINPYFKSYNLIPITPSLDIENISKIIFADNHLFSSDKKSVNTLEKFIKICTDKGYGLIIFNKKIPNPITYNISQLLNLEKSKNFQDIHKKKYGVDISLLERNTTIDKIYLDNKNKWEFNIKTYGISFKDYEKEKDKYIIILDSLANNYYRIYNNYLSEKNYYIRISSIYELYNYCSYGPNIPTRITNLNKIIQNKALPNVFSPIKPDIKKIKNISMIVDPKYLRNNIYLRLNDQFNQILESKFKNGEAIKDNYTYASIIHDEKFLNVFSDIIISEFHIYIYDNYDEYTTEHIKLSEVFSSFLNTVYINQRTFIKEIHDYFKNNTFDFKEDNIPHRIKNHFDEMNKNVLNKLITEETNLYQTILYKINLLKNTFV